MTPENIAEVRASWDKVRSDAQGFASEFYRRLFEMDPNLPALFKSDMQSEGEKLVQMLDFCVRNLERLDTILPVIQDFGQRHEYYGFTAQHYESVGRALIATLNAQLGEIFTPQVKMAWGETYTVLAGAMPNSAVPRIQSP